MRVYVVVEMWRGLIDPAPSVYTDKRDAQKHVDTFIKEHNLAPLTYDDNWEIFGFEVEVTKPRMVAVERRRAMACLQARIS